MKSQKQTHGGDGPKMSICAICGNTVSRPKSVAIDEGRVCRHHLCAICGKPVPGSGGIAEFGDDRGEYIQPTCPEHHCYICHRAIADADARTYDGRRVCKTHPTPPERKENERCTSSNTST